MPGFNSHLDSFDSCSVDDDALLSAYALLFLLTGLALATYAFARFAEFNNRLNYDSRSARIIAGCLRLMVHMLHTTSDDLEITNPENKLITIGPHRTGWEAVVVASKIKGTPPRFFATDAYNSMPGVSAFMKMFKTIPVGANATKIRDGRTSNASALDVASNILNERGCVALFPQGNFSKLGQEPPRVYAGAAKLALQHKIPIHVIRLDGFWCLQNPYIPLIIRNNLYYRAFLSLFHMNNVRAILCCEIDFHLQPESKDLSNEEIINEICAQLYAYYRHTEELTVKEISAVKTEISKKTHLLIWDNKLKQDALGKQLLRLKEEEAQLSQTTSSAMRASSS